MQNGDVTVEENKTLRDYITEYMARAKNDQIHRFATAIGMDEEALRSFMQLHVTAADINDFGKFDQLKATVDMDKARSFFEQQEGTPIKRFKVPMMVHHLLLRFILDGGYDIEKDY